MLNIMRLTIQGILGSGGLLRERLVACGSDVGNVGPLVEPVVAVQGYERDCWDCGVGGAGPRGGG
jgi:hypothetical protein